MKIIYMMCFLSCLVYAGQKETYHYEDWVYSFTPLKSNVIYVNNGNGVVDEVKDSLKIKALVTKWDVVVVMGKDTIYYPLDSIRVREKTSDRIQAVDLPDSVYQFCLKKVVKDSIDAKK